MSMNDTGGTAAKVAGTAKDVAGTAKDEAAGLAHAAAGSSHDLLDEVRHETADVAHEAADQARDLLGEARAGLSSQASEQQGRAAASLRTLGDELGRMAEQSDGGLATDLVRQVADRTGGVATWLEDREPGDVLHEVTDFARRRPGVFLAVAAGVGVLAGRLTRGLKDAPSGTSGTTGSGSTAQHRAPGAVSTAPPVSTPPVSTPDEGYTSTYAAQPTAPGSTTTGSDAPVWPSRTGGPAPVAPASGHVPASDDGGTAGGDPLAGLTREDRP